MNKEEKLLSLKRERYEAKLDAYDMSYSKERRLEATNRMNKLIEEIKRLEENDK